ncbi:MAG TPA: amino acid ABC transporter substrate-binding protein [Candidatus Acetothermia bacterium]|nr:amino acid ABC transporter substrate-binding protein [Candidatus Acetothermia bacterium]HEX32450.1 amino acid ABC transporter substrate-binding protein [Candidatus Acetothermia bacterium]
MKKIMTLVVLGLMVLMSLTALADDTIKIGSLMSLTGALAPYGPAIVDGAKLAVEQINAAGGVLGKKLELVIRDTATSPDVGRDAASKLVQLDHVQAIIGALSSGVTIAASSVTIPAEVVLISPASTSPAIPALDDNDYVFRTVVSDAVQGVVMGRLAVMLNYNKVSVIYVNNAYGKGLADVFKETFESLGGAVPASVPYEENKASYRGEVEKATADNPDAIFMVSYPVDGNKQIVEAVEAGYQGKFLFSDGMKGEGVAPGPACASADNPGPIEGAYGTVASSGFRSDQLDADYSAEFGASAIPYYAQAYDAAMLIALAMERAGDTSGEAIRDNLRAVANGPGEKVYYGEWAKAVALLKAGKDINYEGVSGVVDFKDTGDVAGGITIWKIDKCQVVPVLTVSG